MAADPNRGQGCQLRPHEASCAGARRPGRGSHDGRDRVRGDATSGSGDLGFAAVHRASPDSSHIVEGKFDTVMGRDVLVTTGTYGFRTYDVRDAAHPKALDTYPAARDPRGERAGGRTRTWRSTAAQADHRVARSSPRRRGPDELPGDRPARLEEPQPEVQVGLLRHLLQEPAQARADRRVSRSPRATRRAASTLRYVWTGGPARRDDLVSRAFTPGRAGTADPIWVTDLRDPAHPHVFKTRST